MKCASCGGELPKGAGFCFQCGAKQPGYRFPKKLAIGAAAFLLAVGGACVVGALLMGNHKYVAYLKDGGFRAPKEKNCEIQRRLWRKR